LTLVGALVGLTTDFKTEVAIVVLVLITELEVVDEVDEVETADDETEVEEILLADVDLAVEIGDDTDRETDVDIVPGSNLISKVEDLGVLEVTD